MIGSILARKNMKTECLILSIFIICCVHVSFCHPSKPLNERSTELAWEAWLLVDQTNNNRHNTDDLGGMLRKRITPKSVFIAPTFSPESLPACAEGYKSDSMGRCVKIIKINEGQIFDFLLEKLNAQFPDYDLDDETHKEESSSVTRGPLQLNIPLENNDENAASNDSHKFDEAENETDVAIVVTPSHKRHHHHNHHHHHHNYPHDYHKASSPAINVKRTGVNEKFNVAEVAAILGVTPDEIEMTTLDQITLTEPTSTTTTINDDVRTTETIPTTNPTTTTELAKSTTTLVEETTIESDALFFRLAV